METLEHWVGVEYLRIFLAKESDKIKLLTAIVHFNFKHGIKSVCIGFRCQNKFA